jgi:uncharacterized membrane protein YGL010W
VCGPSNLVGIDYKVAYFVISQISYLLYLSLVGMFSWGSKEEFLCDHFSRSVPEHDVNNFVSLPPLSVIQRL